MTKKIDKYQKQTELIDKAYPYLMKFADFCFENRYAITINVNGGRFEYIVDKPEQIKANNLEDLWDWCCTKVYQLDNGKDVWKQINRVHQLALKEQREEFIKTVKRMKKVNNTVLDGIIKSLKEKK